MGKALLVVVGVVLVVYAIFDLIATPRQQVKVLPKVATPIEITSSDGSLEVGVGGADAEPIGDTGERARQTYVVR